MKYKKYRWLPGIVALFFIIISAFPVYASTQEESPVTFSLEYGFKNNVKNGACFPLKVFLENRGKDFQGILEMEVPVLAENQDIHSSIGLNSDPWYTSKNRIYTYEKKIVLKEGEKRTETFYLELPMFEGTCLVRLKEGSQVVSSEEINCNFSENTSRILMGVISEDKEGIGELDGMQVSFEQEYISEAFVKTIAMETENIYPDPDALQQLDLLIVDQGTEFEPKQQLALDRWMGSGGVYLERLPGESVSQVFQNFIEGERRAEFIQYLEQMQTYTFGDTTGLVDVPVSKRPAMGKYVLLLAVYVLIVGPGLFLVLKKKKKQKYLWGGICLCSLVFVIFIGIMGKPTNLHAPFISYHGLYEQENNVWTETVQMGIQAPYNNEYQLYLDKNYKLLPSNMGSTGTTSANSQLSEQVNIMLGEEKNKVTLKNMSAFTQNCFKLEKNRKVSEEDTIQLEIFAENGQLKGEWKNPTSYHLKNVILIMQNRAAALEDMDAGSGGVWDNIRLHSYGNDGIELLMEVFMDFSKYDYPEYEKNNMAMKSWETIRNGNNAQAYLLAIVENPDYNFQLDSGYMIHGRALFQMPVDIEWKNGAYLWCPNLETYGESQNSEFSPQTNLIHGREATVDYSLDFLGEVQQVILEEVEYNEEKYYFHFQGNVALYCWETGSFEEIQNWKEPLKQENLKRYLSGENKLRIRYLLEDTLDTRNRSCMLPCLQAVGKVE